MEMGLHGKVVVVTGGSKGIGYACAEAFAAEGARVVLVSRSAGEPRQRGRALSQDHATTRDDCCRPDARRRCGAHGGRLSSDKSVRSTSSSIQPALRAATRPPISNAQAWRDAMDAKFFSTIHPTDAVLKRMLARKRGVIVNIIGMGGKVATPVHLPGGAANAALMLATTGLAAAYGSSGIRIDGHQPGRNADRTRAGRTQGRGEADRAGRRRVACAQPGEDPAGTLRQAGRDCQCRRVSRFGAGELRHRCDRRHGWWRRRGVLARTR